MHKALHWLNYHNSAGNWYIQAALSYLMQARVLMSAHYVDY